MNDWWKDDKPVGKSNTYFGCEHWRQQVRVGRRTLTCSAYSGRHSLFDETPDFGIYLASAWHELMGKFMTNGAYLKRVARQRAYPALVVDWADMQAAPVETLSIIVDICISKMQHGKRIDIGCMHGHGRTGTVLACLIGRLERKTAAQAVAAARDRYCKWAVETRAQEESVAKYLVEKLGTRWIRRT